MKNFYAVSGVFIFSIFINLVACATESPSQVYYIGDPPTKEEIESRKTVETIDRILADMERKERGEPIQLQPVQPNQGLTESQIYWERVMQERAEKEKEEKARLEAEQLRIEQEAAKAAQELEATKKRFVSKNPSIEKGMNPEQIEWVLGEPEPCEEVFKKWVKSSLDDKRVEQERLCSRTHSFRRNAWEYEAFYRTANKFENFYNDKIVKIWSKKGVIVGFRKCTLIKPWSFFPTCDERGWDGW